MTKRKIIGGAMAFAAAYVLSVAAFAQHGPGGHHGHGGPGFSKSCFGGPGGRGGVLGHFSRVLDLNDAQKAQLRQIEEGFRESTKGLHEQLANSGGHPFDALASGTFDEAAARAAAQARAGVHVELEVAHAKMLSQVSAVLTAEQKAKLIEMHGQMRERHRQGAPPWGDGGR